MSRYDLSELDLAELLDGEPRYRTTQVLHALYRELAEPPDMTALPRSLRARLRASPVFAPALEVVATQAGDGGATIKSLYRLDGGALVESVLMHHVRRSTVCVSSQAGCAMACAFCATGQRGYDRQLSAGEIVEQVVRAARSARAAGRRLDHVVFMGMGEPLANFAAVWASVERIVGPLGLAARHVTLSTVGVIPGIRALAAKPLQVNLAVSLHAANDELRSELVPLNRRYPIAELVEALEVYRATTRRRISFEWALMAGVNDGDRDVDELSAIARRLGAHVNLIPLNPIANAPPGATFAGSDPARVRAFAAALRRGGVATTVRRTRGRDIDAACGQLVAHEDRVGIPVPRAPSATMG